MTIFYHHPDELIILGATEQNKGVSPNISYFGHNAEILFVLQRTESTTGDAIVELMNKGIALWTMSILKINCI